MPEKLRERMTDVLSKIFGENHWLVANWLREQGNDSDIQDREVLLGILNSFEGEMTIDNRAFLKVINAWAGVEVKGKINFFTPLLAAGTYWGGKFENHRFSFAKHCVSGCW